MATKENLMGLGVPHHVANRLGRTPTLVTAAGTTIADGRVLGATDYDPVVNAGTGGVVIRSPASQESNILLGDEFWLTNMTASSISLWVRGGSFILLSVSVSGSLGLSVGVGQSCIVRPITASTWTVIGSVLSN